MSKTNVLVVEDESIVSKDIQQSLKKLGYNVVGAASTGERAFELAMSESPDIILMDIMLKGSINGNIYFKGLPVYDVKTKAVYLENFDYDLESRSLLIKTANWLLQGTFAKRMKEALTIPIGSQIDEMRNVLQANLSKNQVAKGVLLNGKIETFTPDKVYLTPKSIIAVVMAKGRVDLKVDGL